MVESVLNILDVEVHFPYFPYDCQKLYMKKVIEALNERKNAILESPTGTGKTLSLLCSVLAWRENLYSFGSNPSKVVKELRKTPYADTVNTSVFSSRDNLCIKSNVTQVGVGLRRIQACKTSIKRNQCEYFKKTKDKNAIKMCVSELSSQFVFDIEDLTSLGHQHTVCPYYLAKDIDSKLDFYLMPYNYLINNGGYERENDLKTAEELVDGNIVIFDEAHNIEKFCEDALSTTINSYDLTKCLVEIKWVLRTKFDVVIDYNAVIELEKVTQLLHTQILLVGASLTSKSTKSSLQSIASNITTQNNDSSTIETCEYFFDNILKPSNINLNNFNLIINHIDICVSYLLTYGMKSTYSEEFSLHKLRSFLQTIFYSTNHITNNNKFSLQNRGLQKNAKYLDYKKLNDTFYICFSMLKNSFRDHSERIINVQYWCFTSSIAMSIFKKAYCVILTSGTLAPFDMLLNEILLPFPVQLENTHILKDNSLSVNILSRALDDNTPLLFTYTNRQDINLITKFGQSLVLLIERIPDGTLIFFPSYNLLEKFVGTWKRGGILSHLLKTKLIVVESQDKNEYKNCVKQHHDNLDKLDNLQQRYNGSILIGVFRGKISEGINFSDKACRAVIVVGIPYPPQNDPKIVLKMKSLENQTNNESGKTWYQHQAMRAVNQAIGRVFRHKDDFGMVFLMDERFSYDSNRKCLPMWIQKHINNVKNFDSLLRETHIFFKMHNSCSNEVSHKFTTINHFLEDKKTHIDSIHPKIHKRTITSSNVIISSTNNSTPSFFNVDKAMKRLKAIEHGQQMNQQASIKPSCSLRELLNRKTSQSCPKKTNFLDESIRLISYTKNEKPLQYIENKMSFSSEQQKLLKLLKFFVDDAKIEEFKFLCLRYYETKDIGSFIDASSKLFPQNVIPKLKEFVSSEHRSIFDIYLFNK